MLKNIRSKKYSKGFTLVESLVAIGILSISILGAFTAVQNGIKNSTIAKDEITAFYLAQEGMEYIRNIRDENSLHDISGTPTNWLTGLVVTSSATSGPCDFGKTCTLDSNAKTAATCSGGFGTCPVLNEDPTTGLYGYNSSWPASNFSREVQFTQVNGSLEVKATMNVTWTTRGSTKSFQISESFFNRLDVTTSPFSTSIARDSVSTKAWGNALTWSHTNNGNFLFVVVRSDASTVTGVTYGGVAMTPLDDILVNSTWHYPTYYLVNPPTGANNISVTTAAANIAASAVSYSGVRTSSPINIKTNGNPPLSVTTTVDNDWSIFFCADRTGVSPGASTNTTVLSQPGAGASMTLFDSNGVIHPAGSYTQSCTVGSPNNSAMYAISPN